MARIKQPGAYILTHVQSGHFYIGSTGDLYAREWQHMNRLGRGVHECAKLQSLFDTDRDVSFTGFPFSTKVEAVDEEQRLIDLHKDGLILNLATLNVRNTAASRAANGYRHSEETRKKMADAKKGRVLSEETKAKMRGPRGPHKNPRKPKEVSDV